jgi:pimeloyl-ACP methyl ester carboxylesterase
MIKRAMAASAAAAASVIGLRALGKRAGDRLLDAPRVAPGEAAIAGDLDALGGEVIRLRSRDGLRLAGRWLPAEGGDADWSPDPYEAIVVLHGYSGSVAPDLVEYGPFLRRTANIFGLDFRGHGDSDPGPSTFGMLEVEDIAGALAWLGERGIRRVALFGTSMGGMAAISAVAVLGDGSLPAADATPDAPRADVNAPRPVVVGIVAESVSPEAELAVANRMGTPLRHFLAARAFDGAARRLGADPRDTEPMRVVGLVAPVPLLLIQGEADTTVPLEDARRLAAAGGPTTALWTVPGADHSRSHAVAPQDYERRVTDHLRMAFRTARDHDQRDEGRDL